MLSAFTYLGPPKQRTIPSIKPINDLFITPLHHIYAKVKTDTLKKAGLAFDQSRVSTKCPQEGNGVKLST